MFYKIFKKSLKFFFYIHSPFFLLLIIFIRPLIKLRFSYQSSQRIGDFVAHMEVYLSKRKKLQSEFYDIFIMTDIIANKTYLNLLKKKILVLPNFFALPIYNLILLLKKKLNYFENFILVTNFGDDNLNIYETPAILKPDKKFLKKGQEFLKSLNIPEDAKIVCLIVRDSGYLEKKFPHKDWKYHDYRNCDINDYKKVVLSLTERGYYVFRMGESSNQILKIKNNPKYIDYSQNFRTDFLDIYLGYKCNFCITTGTGWDFIPALTFRKPVVWTNYVPVDGLLPYSKNFLFSMKIYFDIEQKKKLSLNEIANRSLTRLMSTIEFQSNKISLIENSPDELNQIVLEMVSILEGKMNYSHEDLKLQNFFWKKYIKFFILSKKKDNNNDDFNPNWNIDTKVSSKIGNNFLNQNKYLID